ncbi:MAG: hypothetical protein JL50_09925 [Peptococcaceae bacterium BICA1-7]|nr:MAG: hypothetical protein JL50_09925 [Peptococcaceae bacterium BICA1-7]HBV95599.1 NHLP leader peptide family natural product precursor [Desulfotomaculum sp.]
MNNWTEEEVQKVVAQIGQRAASDPAFRKLCLADPAGAVKEVSGKDLPQGLKVRFVENEGAHMTFVLPDPAGPGELGEEDLDKVAGGNLPGDGNGVTYVSKCGFGY